MEITINGKACTCEKGEFLLTVARRNHFDIPTLCHHESLAGLGSCRLCIVEVVENGSSKIVVSCVYPIGGECQVYTDSDKVKKERSVVLMLLKLMAPESREIQELCDKYGAYESRRFTPADTTQCILCGLCTRACGELGTGAISTVNRGVTKMVSTPYGDPSETCIGCKSCAQVCPTGAIPVEETEDYRIIWGRKFKLLRCPECNAVIGTPEELKYAALKAEMEPETLCPSCRKKRMAHVMSETYGTRYECEPL